MFSCCANEEKKPETNQNNFKTSKSLIGFGLFTLASFALASHPVAAIGAATTVIDLAKLYYNTHTGTQILQHAACASTLTANAVALKNMHDQQKINTVQLAEEQDKKDFQRYQIDRQKKTIEHQENLQACLIKNRDKPKGDLGFPDCCKDHVQFYGSIAGLHALNKMQKDFEKLIKKP
jgi:hypothetical protein